MMEYCLPSQAGIDGNQQHFIIPLFHHTNIPFAVNLNLPDI